MSNDFDDTITTTYGESFTHEESCMMARLIYKRFGRDLALATNKWRSLLGNSCTEHEFAIMAFLGREDKASQVLELGGG